MRIRAINGNVLIVDGAGHTIVPGDRLSCDDSADGSTPRAGSMLVGDVMVDDAGRPEGRATLVTVDNSWRASACVGDYLFITHSAAERARAQAVADALAAPFPGLRVRAEDASRGEWAMHWSFEP